MTTKASLLALASVVLVLTGCRPTCHCTVKISHSGGVAQVSPDMVKVPKEGCPKYVITWKAVHADPWLIRFVADTPCDGKQKVLQNGREEVCHLSVGDMTGPYKYFAFDKSDPSPDPGVCHVPNCPKGFLAVSTVITCIDANSNTLTQCGTTIPAGSVDTPGGGELYWRMPAGASVNFEGDSPCEQGRTIPASSPYCSTDKDKLGEFKYTVSTNGTTEYHVRVTPAKGNPR